MSINIPKAELHVHLDGTLTPALVLQLAKEKNVALNPNIFNAANTRFFWKDFSGFHQVFEECFKVIHSPNDYQLMTYLYLKQLAQQNCLYAELIVSPFHAELAGLSYQEMLRGVVDGIDQAKKEFGIEARVLMVFMRHYGPEAAMKYAKQITDQLHPYVVGVNLVGDIRQYEVKEFEKLFDMARAKNLGLSCHAGELEGGPIEIWQAVDILGVSRISHGVRCIEDQALVEHLIKKNITLEVCPSSNVILKMYPDYLSHPLKQLKEAGLKICLNTDDPGFFDIDLAHEYEIAKQYADFTEQDLLNCTKTAINAAFVNENTRQALLAKCI